MRRWLGVLIVIVTVTGMPGVAQAQYVAPKGPPAGPAHATVLGAGAEFLRMEIVQRFPAAVLVVSPNVMPPIGSSLPRTNQYGETFGPKHPAALIAGVERQGAIVVATHDQALDCNMKQGGKCLRSKVYAAAAFSQPVISGDSATVGALTFLAVAPDGKAKAGSVERLGSVGGTDVLLLLAKKAGKWQVVEHKVVARR